MSSTGKEWLFVIIFFVGFTLITVAEVLWLTRKKGVSPKRAATYVLVPNFVVITAGMFVSFVIFAVILALAWDETASKLPAPDLTMGLMVALAVLIPIVMMILIRRLMFRLLQGEETRVGISPWVYSLLSTIVFFIIVFAPPPLIFLF